MLACRIRKIRDIYLFRITSYNVCYTKLLRAVVYSCANPGYPTGGPKDETPPKVKKSTPHNGAMNYKEDEVIIEFDEIIKLDNVNQKFVASPPLKERPKITTLV